MGGLRHRRQRLGAVATRAPGWLGGITGPSAHAETITPTAGGSAFSDEQKKALGEIIKDYLVKNPK